MELFLYNHKVQELLNTDTYLVVNKNPTLMIERQLNNMLRNWHKKNFILDNELFSLRSSGSNLPKTYRLLKIQKMVFRLGSCVLHKYSLISHS